MFAYKAPDLIIDYNLQPEKTYIYRCDSRWTGIVFLVRRMLTFDILHFRMKLAVVVPRLAGEGELSNEAESDLRIDRLPDHPCISLCIYRRKSAPTSKI